MRETSAMDNEQAFVTTQGSDSYHASPDCFRLRGGQNAAPSNGWDQHELVPYRPGSEPLRRPCKECVK